MLVENYKTASEIRKDCIILVVKYLNVVSGENRFFSQRGGREKSEKNKK